MIIIAIQEAIIITTLTTIILATYVLISKINTKSKIQKHKEKWRKHT